MFKMDVTDTSKAHIGLDCIYHADPQKYTIAVEPLARHIHCETNGNILEYGDLAKMDAPVWKNSMCNGNLDAYTRVGENMWELIQLNLFFTNTNQRTEGQHM